MFDIYLSIGVNTRINVRGVNVTMKPVVTLMIYDHVTDPLLFWATAQIDLDF